MLDEVTICRRGKDQSGLNVKNREAKMPIQSNSSKEETE